MKLYEESFKSAVAMLVNGDNNEVRVDACSSAIIERLSLVCAHHNIIPASGSVIISKYHVGDFGR
jgi:hypothetical protein